MSVLAYDNAASPSARPPKNAPMPIPRAPNPAAAPAIPPKEEPKLLANPSPDLPPLSLAPVAASDGPFSRDDSKSSRSSRAFLAASA